MLLKLFQYARKHRAQMRRATLFSILNKFFDILPEVLIGVAVDVVVNKKDSWFARFGVVELPHQLFLLGGLTLVIWICESLFEYLLNIEWRNLAQTLQHELRLDAYSHIQDLDLAYFEDRSTGQLLSILNDDVNQLERFLDGGANSLIQVVTTIILIGGIFFYISPPIALIAFLPIPIILLGAFYFQYKVQPRYLKVRAQAGDIAARLNNNLSGILTIKSFTAEKRELEHVRIASQAYREANAQAIRVSSAFTPLIRMAIMAGFIATLVWGGFLALDGSIAVGSYSVLIFLTQRLLWPMTGLAQTVDLYQRAMASVSRILSLLDTPIAIANSSGKESARIEGEFNFRNVDFKYSSGDTVLKNIDITLPKGQTSALVGSTGSGKSTFVKLLLRFYDPTAGKIELDGFDLKDIALQTLRSHIGFVGQDIFLFHGSVKENIAYGKPNATSAEIEAASRAAEAYDFIMALPQGFETIVGERGQKLSGGQRQRLSIARALLKNPSILILDEATSAVDNETEAAIQRSLAVVSRGRTTIVIAHRLSTIRQADQIIVLDKGCIAERGKHNELIQRDGVYAALWRVQTGEASVK